MKLTVSVISSSSVPKSNRGIIYICCIGFNFDVIASGKWDLGFVKLTGAAAEAAAKEGKPLGEFRLFLVDLYALQTTHFIIYIYTHTFSSYDFLNSFVLNCGQKLCIF